MRKLATIQRITALTPIPGADMIETASVLGWQVVVKKGDFQVGDLAVYFEIDSWLDESIPAINVPAFQERFINWTDPDGKVRRGMRLKTIKLRKQISQGLILKISEFPELTAVSEGFDATEILRVEKWEPAEETKGNGPRQLGSGRQFPAFIQKTDQNRVQNVINQLEDALDEDFEVTIKLDGSSMTVFKLNKSSLFYQDYVEDIECKALRKMGWFERLWWKLRRKMGLNNPPEEFFGVCSRNIELDPEGDSHFAQYVRDNGLFDKLLHGTLLTENYAFQGELIAPSIQLNHEQVKEPRWYVFDVFNIDKQQYLLPGEARNVARCCGFDYVPVLYQNAKLSDFGPALPFDPKTTVEGILNFAEGSGMNPGVKREGVVFKSTSTPFSFKAISNSYLLKKG